MCIQHLVFILCMYTNVNIYIYIKGVRQCLYPWLSTSCKYVDIHNVHWLQKGTYFALPSHSQALTWTPWTKHLLCARLTHGTWQGCHVTTVAYQRSRPNHPTCSNWVDCPGPTAPPQNGSTEAKNAERSEIHWRLDSLNAKSIGTFFWIWYENFGRCVKPWKNQPNQDATR